MNLHRAYFAKALQDTTPHDPQQHRYLPSVVASFRSAWRLIYGLEIAWNRAPGILSRVHLPWSQGLSAAVSQT